MVSGQGLAAAQIAGISCILAFMTPEKWELVKKIFQAALEREPDDRTAFIEETCGDDQTLIVEVGSLLDHHSAEDEVFDLPAFRPISELVEDRNDQSRIGEIVGAYKIESEIGRGGMGTVYLASRADQAYEKKVALKLIKRGFDTDEIVSRFRHERQILAVLEHPNITRLLDGGSTDDGLPFIVMDYVDGLPLRDYANRKKLSVRERLEIFLQVCSAISYAHKNLVIHRDLKPSNILVTDDGMPKLLDFGIAKLTSLDGDEKTVWGTVHAPRAMTPDYASPEQINGERVTTSSDVYSLGVVLYELLTGHHPYKFKKKSVDEINRILTDTSPTKPSSICRSKGVKVAVQHPETVARMLSGDLDNIVLMALRKEPERRYSSVERFAADIKRYLAGMPVSAREDTFGYRASKFVARNKAGVAAGVGIAASLIGGLFAVSRQARIAARQRDRARQEAEKAQKINRFLQKMLSSADPREIGRDLRVADMLRLAARSIENSFSLEPEIAGDLMTTIGLTHLSLGQIEEAERNLRSALDLRLRCFGEDSIEVATSRNNYGKLLQDKGDLASAESLFYQALEILEARGRHELEVADVLQNLGYVRALKGNTEDAIGLHEREIEIRRRHEGENHPNYANALCKLASVLAVQGKYKDAEKLHRQALEIFRAVYGDIHPDIATTLSNLVRDILPTSPDEAERLSLQALNMRRRMLGDDHPEVAWSWYNLAYVLLELKRSEEAEAALNDALRLRGPNVPDEHPVVASCYLLMGRSLMGRRLYGAARAAFETCLELRRRTLPADHWLLDTTHSFLGQCLVHLGDLEKGKKLMQESHQNLRAKLGDGHEQTLQAAKRLASI